jgi:hypothetical protein
MRRWFAMLVLGGLVGCAPPILDQTGAIRCGTGTDAGSCPTGFECRWDHCCPSTSGMLACPGPTTVYPRDESGHVYAPIAGSCPPGYENRFDYCCPSGAASTCPTRIIGAPCTMDSDCDAPNGLVARCLTTQGVDTWHQRFIGGYCTAENCEVSDPNACGPHAYCAVSHATTGPMTYCVRACTLAGGAFFGPCAGSVETQQCLTARDPSDATIGVCYPDCSRVENTGQCDTLHGYECTEVYSGVSACVIRCNVPAGALCPAGLMCSSLTAAGYCYDPSP